MSHKLYYFDARGLNEPLRMIFALGGVEYEEIRSPIGDVPPLPTLPLEVKEKCTWGQVPMLEVEGRKLCQSLAMQRYFAKKFNLVGSNDFEAAQIDEYVDSSKEVFQMWTPACIENDPVKKAELVKELKDKTVDKYLKTFDKIINSNGGKRLVGNSLSWADIWLTHVINNLEIICGIKLAEDFPAVKSLCDTVLATPQIKAWIEKRPKSRF